MYGRLSEHRKTIKKASDCATDKGEPFPLRTQDFECRRLVCATNAQLAAEQHLIRLFKPIWNSEIRICWGIGKHGDSADTRKNKRSPWDVLHPGRDWALDVILKDKMSPEKIAARIAKHLASNPPYRDRDHIIQQILSSFSQNATGASDQDSLPGETGAEPNGGDEPAD
ncbi:Restriction endonuclease, type II, Eco29kI [mine drainage metagenome]|uniref:Restriction endonuclease, type II, Eco29kI n=1 Tax=mine drainage metagenome TaxID=410659 RepID=T0ZNP0_9ZZZZ